MRPKVLIGIGLWPHWKTLRSDDDATFDRELTLDANKLEPMVTYGTNPGQGVGVSGTIPTPDSLEDPAERRSLMSAMEYMDMKPGQKIAGQEVNVVFIGSCTNGRIEDLRAAADVVKGKNVDDGVWGIVVPGSKAVKAMAEAEGLDRIFSEAGFEWREAGCSMCLAMNQDKAGAGKVRRQHQQPQLPRPPRPRLAQPAHEPTHGCCSGNQWPCNGCT